MNSQREFDLDNLTPKQKDLDDARIALSKKRSMKMAEKYMAFLVTTDRLKVSLGKTA